MTNFENIDTNNLLKADLEMLKLKMEISILQDQIRKQKPPSANIVERIQKFLLKNIGPIGASIVILGGVITPIMNYIAIQRKANLIHVSNDVFKLISDSVFLSNEQIENISVQDPYLVAPYLLDRLSDNDIRNPENAVKIYTRMYKLNKELSARNFLDHIVFLFTKSNKKILESELCDHATSAFEKEASQPNIIVMKQYLDIIYQSGLKDEAKFTKIVDILRGKCKNADYKYICTYLMNLQ